MNTIIYKQTSIGEIVDADEKNGIVKGYGSIFGNIDSDGDMITMGAYKKTIQENGERVKYLYQHDIEKPIGKMRELYEDSTGLAFVAEVPKTRLGMDVIELIKSGVITENSVGIMPIQKRQVDDYRELSEVKLYEISAVTLAANDQAKILDVKNQKNRDAVLDRYDRLTKLIRKSDISDDMGYAIEAEIQKLKSLFVQNFTLPQEERTTPKETNDDEILKYIINSLKS